MTDIGDTAAPIGTSAAVDCDDAHTRLSTAWTASLADLAGRYRADLDLRPPIWPFGGADTLAQWARAAGVAHTSATPGGQVEIGMYRITRTADERPTLAVEGPRGATTTIEGARLVSRTVAWIEADALRLRGAA